MMDVETASETVGKTPFERWVAVLVGLAGLVAALLATLQIDANTRGARATNRASRLSIEAFEKIAGSGVYRTFEAGTFRDVVSLEYLGEVRPLAAEATGALLEAGAAIGAADARAAERLGAVSEAMAALPDEESGVDPETREVLGASIEHLTGLVQQQNDLVDEADRHGARGSRSVFGLSLLAVAAVLLALASVVGAAQGGRIALVAGGVSLAAAAAVGASALFI